MSLMHPSTASYEATQALIAELGRSGERFLATLSDVPERLQNVRESESAWAILDCVEHVCLAEDLMAVSLQKRRSTTAEPHLHKDAVIRKVALDRSRKIVAPETARPEGRYQSLTEAADAFRASRKKNIAFVESLCEDLRSSTCLHPLGVFDTFQFIQIMALHPERHAMQIEEIKNSAAYRAAIQALKD